MVIGAAVAILLTARMNVQVSSIEELQRAVQDAKPGTVIQIQSGTYRGGISFSNIHGTASKPIEIRGSSSAAPPIFVGGTSGLQFSNVSYLELRDLRFEKATGNGLNIDDGGSISTPSHHVTLRRIIVRDLPKGNHDGIKLSGVDDFRVESCQLERWGGSGIDLVGCHRGVIEQCTFRDGGDSGVQAKGGSSEVAIRKSRFLNAGLRSINLGGSTGMPYFRPSVAAMGNSRYEARNLTVEHCTFVGGGAPIAFVGCDGAVVKQNTIIDPGKWAIRILLETTAAGFVPCRNGVFEGNLIVFSSNNWSAGGVNIGPGTDAGSFKFTRNWWFCKDRPNSSKPSLPTAERDGVYGRDPLLTVLSDGTARLAKDSPAKGFGAE